MAPVWGAGLARRVCGVGPPAPLRGGRGAGSLGTAAGGGGPEAPAEGEKQGAPSEPSCRLHSQGTGSSFSRAWPCSPGRGLWVTVAVGEAGPGAGRRERPGRLAEELEEAVLTVRLVVLLLEGALVELLEAEGTDEVLRVELLGHGGDAAARDGLLAAGAQRAAPLVVVHLAVGLPVVLEEAAVDERREAFLRAEEGVRRGKGLSWGRGSGSSRCDGQETLRVTALPRAERFLRAKCCAKRTWFPPEAGTRRASEATGPRWCRYEVAQPGLKHGSDSWARNPEAALVCPETLVLK